MDGGRDVRGFSMHCQAGQRLHMRCDHRRVESNGRHKPLAEESNQHGIQSEEGSMALQSGSQVRYPVTQKRSSYTSSKVGLEQARLEQARHCLHG